MSYRKNYTFVVLLIIFSMFVSTCTPPSTQPVDTSPIQNTGCDIISLSLQAPAEMVEGSQEYISVKGIVSGSECEQVELTVDADGETIIAEVFDVQETQRFYAYAQIAPAQEVIAQAISNTGYEVQRNQTIEIVESEIVPGIDLVLEDVSMDAAEERYEIYAFVAPHNNEPFKGMMLCMTPCVDDDYYSLRASSTEVYVEEESAEVVTMLPVCMHPTFVTCRAINDDVDLPAWATLASQPVTRLVDGLEPADLDHEEVAAAAVWTDAIAPLYPWVTASQVLQLARHLDLEEQAIQMDIFDAQMFGPEMNQADSAFLRVMVGAGWSDLDFSRNAAFFLIPPGAEDIPWPDDTPPIDVGPPGEIPAPPGNWRDQDPLKDLGLLDIDSLSDPLKVQGLRKVVEDLTNPEGKMGNGRPPISSPWGRDHLPHHPGSMSPEERLRTVLGVAWTNFARSINQPPGGYRGPVSSNDPTYAGGWFGKVMDFTTLLVSEVVEGAVGAGTSAVSTLWTVGSGLYQALSGPGAVYNCDNLGSKAAECHRLTDAAAHHYDPADTSHGTPAEFCYDATRGYGANTFGTCVQKTQKKWNDFCEKNPEHSNCKKYCDAHPNKSGCKSKSSSSQSPTPTKKPKPPAKGGYCTQDNPDCEGLTGPQPQDFLSGERHVLNITLKVCNGKATRVLPGQKCEVVTKTNMAVAAKQVEAALCKKQAEGDVQCRRQRVTAIRYVPKHRPRPLPPE